MKMLLTASLVAACVLVPLTAAAQTDTRPGVAVFPFYNGGSYGRSSEDLAALQVGLQQLFISELAMNTNLRVVERSALRELIAEQDLGASGRVDANTAARLGRLVGARYAVLGGFIDNDGQFRIDARIVDVETSEVLKGERLEGRRDRMYATVLDLSTRLLEGVDLPPLPADQRDARGERRSLQIPDEAVQLYSRAQIFQDAGNTDRAIQLYQQITDRFPAMTEARQALRQLQGG
jgi:TolB-like protein